MSTEYLSIYLSPFISLNSSFREFSLNVLSLSVIYIYFCLFAFARAAPAAYGGSQVRGLIGAVATSLCLSHSNRGSELCPRPTPQQCRILNPLSEARDQTRNLMVPNWIY